MQIQEAGSQTAGAADPHSKSLPLIRRTQVAIFRRKLPVKDDGTLTMTASSCGAALNMGLIASVAAYLGTVLGISIGLLMLLCAFLTSPGH
jgi:hypothetical protein